jgi:branched-chain amino acid transport system substrate-binding protein
MTRSAARSFFVASSLALVGLAPLSAAAQLAGQEIHIGVGGPLTTGSATFGVEMRQAVDLAVAEKNASGGILGAKLVADTEDDKANAAEGEKVAKSFCDAPRWAWWATLIAASPSPPRKSMSAAVCR